VKIDGISVVSAKVRLAKCDGTHCKPIKLNQTDKPDFFDPNLKGARHLTGNIAFCFPLFLVARPIDGD